MALLAFKHPFTSIVSGPTGCGKTSFVLNVIDNVDTMIEPTLDKIILSSVGKFSTNTHTSIFVKSYEIEDIRVALVILDDMMIEVDQNY